MRKCREGNIQLVYNSFQKLPVKGKGDMSYSERKVSLKSFTKMGRT